MKISRLLPLALLLGTSTQAVVVTDSGLTAPTFGSSGTGYLGPTDARFGWDNETVTQTFTLASAGTLDSFFMGYNAFEDGDTITLDISINGSSVATGLVLDGDNFSGTGSDNNNGPNYWMQFDFSSENISLNAGLNTIVFDATANGGNSWALAPRYWNAGGSGSGDGNYIGGVLTASGNPGFDGPEDLAFAVTIIPEPSAFALLGMLGGFMLLKRRRSCR